ncbi:zinc finger C2HC domain-containing protein 1C isoform X2 [Pteronotus mesoamericanus]|uniref:zinc finger C2HC domain-containing protein 1C isoform X2 n=1 Tax=Pteronotus mesoamericanus TaxID=1884717 RepID=UPI0023EDC430|nr:zinc finger C2HC domain-containing protein 1C isoform X2 [Pteronotus parnellii mesoamericanus]
MAGLHLALPLPVGVMLPYKKTDAPGFHSAKENPYEKMDSSQLASTGHPRNTSQEKFLSNKEPTLNSLHTQSKWNTCTKAWSYFYPRCAGISQQDPRSSLQSQAKDLFYSSGPQSWYPRANNQKFFPFTKKRVGVDRAYPLKPVFHRKSRSTGEAGVDWDQDVSPRPPEPREFSYSSSGLRNWANSSAVSNVAAMQEERAMANPKRTEWTQIQRLEATGESLEEEIRRKETLLKEKLKKTEEELRRIQKEKEQFEENEKREPQRLTPPRRKVKGNSNSLYKPIFSQKYESKEAFSRDSGEGETWGWSHKNSSPFQFSDYGIQKLKRGSLVASNNKIQNQVSEPVKEKFSQPSEAPGSALPRSTSNSNLSRAPDSSGSNCSTEEPELGECSHCGRKFLLLRLERHSTVCSRLQGSRRKVFDSVRARAKGTELEQYLNWKGPASVKAEPPPKSNWRQKHESFIRTLRQAREVQQVAERHIPKCKTIKNRPPPPRKHCS